MNYVIDAAELLRIAVQKHGSISAVARKTRLFRSTLKRIKKGETIAPHPETLAKLVRVINNAE
jgi:DNA invertase Pin-like site-specific DNA recombinase